MEGPNAAVRRAAIAAILEEAEAPVSAATLARRFSVSRQIIVGDVALLRAGGAGILATPRGYLGGQGNRGGIIRKLACIHAPEDMERELTAIVDAGGEVLDVVVEHPVYGQLTGELHIRSRCDVTDFLHRVEEGAAKPLSGLTGGVHLHTVRCSDGETACRVEEALRQEGFLYKMQDL